MKIDTSEIWRLFALILAMAQPKGEYGHPASHHNPGQSKNGLGKSPVKGYPLRPRPHDGDSQGKPSTPDVTSGPTKSGSSSTSVPSPVSTYKPLPEQKCPDGSSWFEFMDGLNSVDERAWNLDAANGALISYEDGMRMTLNQSAVR